jgi:hypothetical protein
MRRRSGPIYEQLRESQYQAAYAYVLARVLAFKGRWDVAEEMLVTAIDAHPADQYVSELQRIRRRATARTAIASDQDAERDDA